MRCIVLFGFIIDNDAHNWALNPVFDSSMNQKLTFKLAHTYTDAHTHTHTHTHTHRHTHTQTERERRSRSIKSWGWIVFSRINMYICLILLQNVSKKTNKYNLPWSSNYKSFHPPDLENQWMFEPFAYVMVACESLSCLKYIYSHCWKRFRFAKTTNLQDLKGSHETTFTKKLIQLNKNK